MSNANDNALTGVQRAAVLLLSLGEEDAAEVLKHMNAKEVQKLGIAMATISGVSREQVMQVISTFGEALDKQTSLGMGADDYVAKPFDIDELDARLRALLRRAAGRAAPTIRHGGIELDPAARTVRLHGQLVEMSPREFSVLRVLLEARGHVLSRQQIEERLYSWDAAIESNAVEVHIHHLRRKLGSGSILTMRGVGYFIPQEAA